MECHFNGLRLPSERTRKRAATSTHFFPHILITATVSTGYIYIITLVCSSREKTHLLGKKQRPNVGTHSPSALQAVQA